MSSDSEEDYYGNVTKKLQKLKDGYQAANMKTTNLLNINTSQKNANETVKFETNSEPDQFNDSAVIDQIIALNAIEKKQSQTKTLNTRKRKSVPACSRGKRGKFNSNLNESRGDNTKSTTSVEESSNRSTRRGRRRPLGSKTLSVLDRSPKQRNGNVYMVGDDDCDIGDDYSIFDQDESVILSSLSIKKSKNCKRKSKRRIPPKVGPITPSSSTVPHSAPRNATPRGRNRGGSRRTGTRGQEPVSTDYSVYSIGNTDEYPDNSDSVTLFKKNEIVDINIEEVDESDDNEELSVKVYWQSVEIVKFTVRRYQKLIQIFEYFSNREGVGMDYLLLTYNDRILRITDTPDKIGYNIAKFIEGGVVNHGIPQLNDYVIKEKIVGIQIKFQCQDVKKPFIISVNPEDNLMHAMVQCAEHFEKPLTTLKFEFDGDCITGRTTVQELELEGGECIDVKMK